MPWLRDNNTHLNKPVDDGIERCDLCGHEISEASLLVISDDDGFRMCSEDCQDESNFIIKQNQ